LGEYKEVAEAAERHEQRGGPRFIPLAAAIVAVLAALATLMSHQRSSQALQAKNNAILAFTHASDSYNYYEAKGIKEETYRAALIVSGRKNPTLQAVIDHEHETKAPVLEKARGFERQGGEFDERSERFVHSYETLEIGATFLEVAIVLLSISTIAGTTILPIVAGAATLTGVGFAIFGLWV
jgi:hypothetical protein